jgi:hypothetical protein
MLPAQRIDVGAFGLFYCPLGRFHSETGGLPLAFDTHDLAGPGFGARAHLGFPRRFGIEGSISDIRTPVLVANGFDGLDLQAEVTFAVLQGQYDLSPVPERYSIWVGAGPALIQHGGEVYSPSARSVGPAMSARYSLPLTPHLQFGAGLTMPWYSFSFPPLPEAHDTGRFQYGPQRDLSFQAGLDWRFR